MECEIKTNFYTIRQHDDLLAVVRDAETECLDIIKSRTSIYSFITDYALLNTQLVNANTLIVFGNYSQSHCLISRDKKPKKSPNSDNNLEMICSDLLHFHGSQLDDWTFDMFFALNYFQFPLLS